MQLYFESFSYLMLNRKQEQFKKSFKLLLHTSIRSEFQNNFEKLDESSIFDFQKRDDNSKSDLRKQWTKSKRFLQC